MNEIDKKSEQPIHLVLGTCDFTKIKTQERSCAVDIGEQFGEITKMGVDNYFSWTKK